VGIKTLHFGVYGAAATHKNGNPSKCEVLQRLGTERRHNTTKKEGRKGLAEKIQGKRGVV
jgi:hypothetical protein